MKTYICILATTLLLALAANAQDTISVCGSGSGDPHFTGFRGQRFEFQGSHGNVYNLVSSPSTQLNARFLGNSQWGDSRTFMDAVSVQTGSSRFSVSCMNSTLVAEVNGRTLPANSPVVEDELTAFVEGSKALVGTPLMGITITKAKNRWASCYINVDVSYYENVEAAEDVHGLIGQTVHVDSTVDSAFTLTKYEDGAFAIEGSDNDYMVAEGHLFGNTFRFNKFVASAADATGRKLLGFGRSLLVDCSPCTTPSNPCAGHPDGMNQCGINDITGSPECYNGDTSTFCPPSGCAVSPDCATLTPAPAGSCGSFTNMAQCANGYSTVDNTLCQDDGGICIGTSQTCTGGAQSSSSSVDADLFQGGHADVTGVLPFGASMAQVQLAHNGENGMVFMSGGSMLTSINDCSKDIRLTSCSAVSATTVGCDVFYDSFGTCQPNGSKCMSCADPSCQGCN